MANVNTISPCLWFDQRAEEAARFYVSVFTDARIDRVAKSAVDWPNGKTDDVILVEFTLAGQSFQALNGGPDIPFTEAVSLSVQCEDQAEVDAYWDALLAGGGEPIQCGWLKDRFGMRWQIVPAAYMDMMYDDDPNKVRRVMAAMLQMIKLDVDALVDAYNGNQTE